MKIITQFEKIEEIRTEGSLSNRYKKISKSILDICIDAEIITESEVITKSNIYKWICQITYISVASYVIRVKANKGHKVETIEQINDENDKLIIKIIEMISRTILESKPKYNFNFTDKI
ncbi:hypothetical protein [Photobacterium lutimaris]|uniref:Uncharacterized protein n=1 Tax=Photobacterium lutimaris TaxID=388278 RepID=A0A2T3IIB3_9GAMM|nr:hypothetical protein [Photobacterium lutimaris]PSU28078.1 hypothetical protein C9I99_26435 [Photobacterium lutimaris]TDR70176.1 hypothetical protein DFP78_12418 [Photobacterium lutimaris]